LGLSTEKVRVIVGDVGGGFGMKTGAYPEDVVVAYAAHTLQKPVKWIADRSEEFLSSAHGRDISSKASLALDAKGKILGLRVDTLANVGAYPTMTGIAIQLLIGPWVQTSVYDIPLIDFHFTGVMTNTATTGAYRGAGRPEAIYNIERLMDEAARMEGNAYTTPYELVRFDPAAEGFADTKVNRTPRSAAAERATPVTVEEGRRLSEVLGCVACHSVKDQDLHHVGPRWKGLFGSERKYIDSDKKPGATVANEAYLRESILQPAAKKVAGFERGEYAMPSYAGAVTDAQVDALIVYIKSLSR
jgi:cytochrome c2